MADGPLRPPTAGSPCIGICRISAGSRLCIGCHRTLDEIARWSVMTPEARRAVMATLAARNP